jgi:cyclopropane fatty-acyl-phospholipid synthase-like methyltransferase
MSYLGRLIHLLANALEERSYGCQHLANFLKGFLPALLPPARIISLVSGRYAGYYRTIPPTDLDFDEQPLAAWEEEVLDRYRVHSGRMLILGSGLGREAVAIARRGVQVLGVELNNSAARTADNIAKSFKTTARFVQADYFEFPCRQHCFEYALLSCSMYCAIPGRSRRQAWVANLGSLLAPHGLLMFNFLPERQPVSRLRRLRSRVNTLLARLPGANATYQPGDMWEVHFWHAFHDEEEIRKELHEAGAETLELNWAKLFAVVTFPAPAEHSS